MLPQNKPRLTHQPQQLNTVGENIKEWGQEAGEDIKYGAEQTGEAIVDAAEATGDAIASAYEATQDALISVGQSIEEGTENAARSALEGIRDGLDSMESGIDEYLGAPETVRVPVEPELTEAQVECQEIFGLFDTDQNNGLSWDEWKQYVIDEKDPDTLDEDRDINYWVDEKMYFNYIDFNRDELISVDEFEYHLDHPSSATPNPIQNTIFEEGQAMSLMSETEMIKAETDVVRNDMGYLGNMQMFGILGMAAVTIYMVGAKKCKGHKDDDFKKLGDDKDAFEMC